MQDATNISVYIVGEDSKVKLRKIELTGSTSKDGLIVKSGLKAGEQIVVSNIAKLKPNTKVKIIEGKE
jgi:membrane fusion protein (multidrug efflux system)